MKLAAIYNVFDCEELLEGSIKQIYPYVDCVIVVVQSISNYGEQYDGGIKEVERLYGEVFVYEVDEFKPKIKIGAANEIEKRNIGIGIAKELRCTHFILMDCDEYYDSEQFLIARELIEQKKYSSSACSMFTYFKEPRFQIYPKENYYVPFICELNSGTQCGVYEFPVMIDPTRAPNDCGNNFYLFRDSELMMHHYSHVRKNYLRKLNNSSARINWNKEIVVRAKEHEDFKIGNSISFFPNKTIIEVENYFNINLDNQ